MFPSKFDLFQGIIVLVFPLIWFCPSCYSNQLPLQQLLIPGPPSSNDTATSSASAGPHIDLLSGDYATSAADNSLALVPISEPLTNSATEHNALVLSDVFSQTINNNGNNTPTTPFDSSAEAPAAQACPSPQLTLYSNGSIPNSGVPPFQQVAYQGVPLNNGNAWNGQVAQGMNLQQPPLGKSTMLLHTYIACGQWVYSNFLSVLFHHELLCRNFWGSFVYRPFCDAASSGYS